MTNCEQWRPAPNPDLSFLLSPRHFAVALATDRVAGVRTELSDGLKAIRYFAWFSEVLDRASHNSELENNLIRHARWSHQAEKVGERVEIWIARMEEWDEVVTLREEGMQQPRLQIPDQLLILDVFRPSRDELEGLNIPEIRRPLKEPLILHRGPSEEQITNLADWRLAEGRKGAAQQQLRLALELWDDFLMSTVQEPTATKAEHQTLVAISKKLADAGDIDGAAVILTRHIHKRDNIVR